MTRTVLVLLSLVLAIFSFVVFQGLDKQGLLYHDTGMNLLEAKFIGEGLETLLTLSRDQTHHPNLWEDLKSQTTGVPPHVGKPGLSLTLWIASLWDGFHDTLSAKVTALSGILGLILVFLIGSQLNDRLTGIYAAASLASSTFYLIYSRAALADQVVGVFFLLGFFLYTRFRLTSTVGRFFVGLAFGLAFSCNQWRVSYLLPLLIAAEILSARLGHGRGRELWQRIFLIVAGFVTPILLFQVPYLLLKIILGPFPFPDYWQQLYERFQTAEGIVWFKDWSELGRQFWKVEGGVFALLVALSWLFLSGRFLLRRRFEDFLVLFFSLTPFLYFSSMKYGGAALPRTMAITLPVAALCVGEFLRTLHQTLSSKSKFLAKHQAFIPSLIVAGLLIPALPRHTQTGVTRSGYPQASQYLAQTGERKFMILGLEPVWRFYLGRVAYEPYSRPASLKELVEKSKAAGIQHLVVDYSTLHSKYGMEYTGALIGRVKPVATFGNPRGRALAYLLDEYGLEKSVKIASDPRSEKIYVFSIKDVADALNRGEIPV